MVTKCHMQNPRWPSLLYCLKCCSRDPLGKQRGGDDGTKQSIGRSKKKLYQVYMLLLLLLSSHMLFAWGRISRYIVKDAPAGVTTVERPHILSTAVHALGFLSREGSGRPYPSSTLRSNFVYPRQISRSPRTGHCMS